MLQVLGLSKKYKDKEALSDINLTLPDKGLVVIKGESGSGKTTLLNMLTANDFPTTGTIRYQGVEITPKTAEKYRTQYCGNIYQDYMLIEDLTVKENIELALQVGGQDYTIDDIKALLHKVDLPEDYLDKKVIRMSGGEKQRVAIARAISKQDAMIFADEPTGNLDSKNGQLIMELLKAISAERLVVLVSHNERYNKKYADYSIKLVDGRIRSCDLPEDPSQIEEKNECPNDTGLFKPNRKNLRPKTMARLAYWGFEKNRIKCVLAIIAFIVFTMLATTSLTATLADHNLAVAKTLDNGSQRNVMVLPRQDADSSKIEAFCNRFTYKNSPVYRLDYSTSYNAEEMSLKLEYAIIYDESVGTASELVYGAFPKEPNEIAIPHYFAKYISENLEEYRTDGVQNLIGKTFTYNSDYPFQIVGIFDEGKYIDDFQDLTEADEMYIKHNNFMARVAFFGKGAKEIFNKNSLIFNNAPARVYSSRLQQRNVLGFGYDMYAPYSKQLAPLQEGEIYVNGVLARSNRLQVGDRISVEIGYYEQANSGMNYWRVGVLENLIIKGIAEDSSLSNLDSIIYSESDYEKHLLAKGHDKYHVEALYFNLQDEKDSYAFFKTMGRESEGLFDGPDDSPHMNVKLQNMGAVNNVYKFSSFYGQITGPLTGVLFAGLLAMGAVSSMYLMAAKEKSYNILRAIGCGKKNIMRILFFQLFTILAVELVFGLVFAKLLCVGISNLLLPRSTSGLAGVSIGLMSEEILVMGWIPPVIVIAVTVVQTCLSILIKTKHMFSKSVMEYKTY